MKRFIIGSLLLLSLASYSQTSIKTKPISAANLNQYLWSFSKNKAIPNEKSMIDFDVMDNWRGLGYYLSVSADGNWFVYTMNKMVYNDFAFGLFKLDSLIIQSTKTGQRTVLPGINPGTFTTDSRQYIFQDKGTLCFLQLGSIQIRKMNDVASYKISQNKWLAYQLKDKSDLIIQNMVTGKEKQFAAIKDFDFDNSGKWLVCKNNTKELLLYSLVTGTERRFLDVVDYAFAADGKSIVVKSTVNLQYVNLPQGDAKIIWTSKEKTGIGSYSLDATGKQVAFTVVDSANECNNAIWYYAARMDKAVLKFNTQTAGIPSGLAMGDMSFTDNGHYIKFLLQAEPEIGKPKDDIAGLEVWNSKDLYLQSAQAKQLKQTAIYNSIINIENDKLVFLESNDKKLMQQKGDFALLKKDYNAAYGDRFWEKQEDSCWIISLKDGSSHLLPTRSDKFWFSPAGNYLVYFDADKGCHYYSYDLHTGVVNDISANVPKNQLGFTSGSHGDEADPISGNLAAWVENDEGVLVYDNYDIWRLDLSGRQTAVNLTSAYGQNNHTIFNLFLTDRNSNGVPLTIVKPNETLLLRAFNDRKKENGFYRKPVARAGAPELLYMGEYFMNLVGGIHDGNVLSSGIMPLAPVKAKNSSSWIVQRQSSNDAPNFYETTDFKNFRRLTNYQPQKGYQWLTEELHTFKYLDGKMGQGILYKPENFDPNKKYPVLIAFYGAFSNNMFQFHFPSYIDEAMATGRSPVWFLNNGYLVFTPDIAVTPLKYGPKAYSVIEGAAQYLKTLPYVDGNKFGCGTHSWSGKLGAYMFTHSKSIAATAITEGFLYANPLHQYLSSKNSQNGLEAVEVGMQYGSLWENKAAWLDQTTVLNVDKATSPLLLLCNKESAEDYQEQTFQFFNALRRLDKNVWWLKYDKGSHTLSDQKELKDYTIRYTQFFDHYLKNAPAPMWMTQGIPYRLKGIESRYELDPQGTCNSKNGEPCPICQAWNAQFKKTSEMFLKEIKDWNLDKDIADELEAKEKERRKELDKQGEIQTKEVMKMLNK